jgi:hypothetical protein
LAGDWPETVMAIKTKIVTKDIRGFMRADLRSTFWSRQGLMKISIANELVQYF